MSVVFASDASASMQQPVPQVTSETVDRALRRKFRESEDIARYIVTELHEFGPRVQLAAIAASNWSLEGLQRVAKLAQRDTRDVIVSAEYRRAITQAFADAPDAAKRWMIIADWIDYCWSVGDETLVPVDALRDVPRNPLLFPTLRVTKHTCLSFSFERPHASDGKCINWLLARDWLIATFNANFTNGFEAPTCEWLAYAHCTWQGRTHRCSLYFCDFPESLELIASSVDDNDFLLAVREGLAAHNPDLGDLDTMDGKAWRGWLEKLPFHAPSSEHRGT